jgi:BlaI family transcriptional regulator, penicillinase repressor
MIVRRYVLDTIKLFDSEYKLMEIIWDNEPVSAKDTARIAKETIGWNKNTTYTIIKKLISKNAVKRTEPNFICTSLVKKEDVQRSETREHINRLYNGSKKAFFAAFIDDGISEEELLELRKLIEKR